MAQRGPPLSPDDYACLRGHTPADCPVFVPQETLACVHAGCIACAYKVVGRPAAPLRAELAQCPRPEQCLRHGKPGGTALELYQDCGRVLVLGDGNLTFSLALCRRLPDPRCVTATTYLTAAELVDTYGGSVLKTVANLRRAGAMVLHGVDATALGTEACPLSRDAVFHRVLWNFPCVAPPTADREPGGDGQNEEMERNKVLLANFFECSLDVLVPGGELHIVHKTKPPFCHWDLPAIASPFGYTLRACLVFDRSSFAGYTNKKARSGAGSFPIFDARTFIFTAPLVTPPRRLESVPPSTHLGTLLDTAAIDSIVTVMRAAKGGPKPKKRKR